MSLDDDIKKKLGVSDDNLLPDSLIDTFCKKIKEASDNNNQKQVDDYVRNATKVNGGQLPKKIEYLLKEM
jgi:hypothetical protein